MGLANLEYVTRTTGCPNGCARPYMAELAFVGSGPNMYQVWLGGHPAQAERTGVPVASLFKMKLDDLEKTMEPCAAPLGLEPPPPPHSPSPPLSILSGRSPLASRRER